MAHALVWNGYGFEQIPRGDAERAAKRGELHAYLDGAWICVKDGKKIDDLQFPEFYNEIKPEEKVAPAPVKKTQPKKKAAKRKAAPKAKKKVAADADHPKN